MLYKYATVSNNLGDEVDPSNASAVQHQAVTIAAELGRLLDGHLRALMSADQEGISLFDIEILRLLVDQGGARASYLADEFGLTRTSISRHVTLLTEEGLIDQHPDAKDRRAVQLEITAAGRDALTVQDERRREITKALTTDWSEDERQLVATFLARLNVRTTEYIEQNLRRSRTQGGAR
jgi:DNA-binding MarR family transcriptional regulator